MVSPLSFEDCTLVRSAVRALARPLRTKTSSFILHAPLELSARVELLARVSPQSRMGVRARIAVLVEEYTALDTCIDPPEETFSDHDTAWAALLLSAERQDVDAADRAITYLARHLDAHVLRKHLIDWVAPMLSAAAHTPILLSGLESLTQRCSDAPLLLRGPVRRLAIESTPGVQWHRNTPRIAASKCALFPLLAQPPRVASASTWIAPMVLATETSGLPAQLLPGALDQSEWDDTARMLLRIAALSMLQDSLHEIPYGWTHCLTIPLGILQNADVAQDRKALLAIAATHVLAMRATLGTACLKPHFDTQPLRTHQSLIDEAAQHPDAHVAKYALACLHSAHWDVQHASLYFAALERLLVWWENKSTTRIEKETQ